MTQRASVTTVLFAGGLAALSAGGLGISAQAQDAILRRPAQQTAAAAPSYRGLTITRPPDAGTDAYGSDEPYVDGPTRYNDIRDFSPFPSVDSGRQFPYGLDGVGGYGSDIGFNEGSDAAVYDRGAFNRSAR